MRTVGIIAEYNPFHNGHAYQIQKAKEASNADFAVVVMSPDFVQRGEPALVDKYSRTRMALNNGADLVLELPVCYATGSAEYFAEGGVSLLHNLGCIDTLSFGCENDNPDFFFSLAKILLEEPDSYREKLLTHQKKGETFPKARELALLEWMSEQNNLSFLPEMVSDLLSNPNNILGLEYCKALTKMNSSIAIAPIKRVGSGYHSLEFKQEFCSASAVRSKILSTHRADLTCSTSSSALWSELIPYLPENVLTALQEQFSAKRSNHLEQFSSLLYYKLLSEASDGFKKYLDVTPDLSDRIQKLLPQYTSALQFISLLKTKQVTETRIRRALLHILLNITSETTEHYRTQGSVFYTRVLGFRKNAGPLLHQIKEHSSIPMITKLADAKKILSGSALQMLTQDIYASHVYQLGYNTLHQEAVRSEYTCSPIIF